MKLSELSNENISKLRQEVKELMASHLGNMQLFNYWKDIAKEVDNDRCRRVKLRGSEEE